MLYQPPVGGGASDPYVTGVPGSTPGSIPPGESIEHPQREIINVIVAAGLTPSAADLTQLLAALNAGWNLPTGLHYQGLPGGRILQWGTTGNVVSDTSVAVTFDIEFPNACHVAFAIPHVSVPGTDAYALLISKSTTGAVFVRGWYSSMAAETLPLDWFAIGD